MAAAPRNRFADGPRVVAAEPVEDQDLDPLGGQRLRHQALQRGRDRGRLVAYREHDAHGLAAHRRPS